MSRRFSENTALRQEQGSAKPSSVEAVLRQALRKFGIDQELTKYKFVLHWPEIVGQDIADRTKPESLAHGVLSVRVVDSVWAQELGFHKQAILKRLKRYLEPDQNVEDVRFFVGNLR
ncbi:MAG: DUF721 domain-containing protein [Oligoflexia bacterium]|nr:DUF721 domain-containing protein [Oligoflexia bacterium]